jgi:hypothetical protein
MGDHPVWVIPRHFLGSAVALLQENDVVLFQVFIFLTSGLKLHAVLDRMAFTPAELRHEVFFMQPVTRCRILFGCMISIEEAYTDDLKYGVADSK